MVCPSPLFWVIVVVVKAAPIKDGGVSLELELIGERWGCFGGCSGNTRHLFYIETCLTESLSFCILLFTDF